MDRVYQHAYANRVPISCMIELTKCCNFRCSHCYAQPHEGFLETAKALDDIQQLSKMGCLSYILTGGEAMLHPDFEEICLEVRRNLGVVTLFTNGFALSDERIDFLRIVKPQAVDVTLYGASDDTYKKLCGVERGFTTVFENVERALAGGLSVYLKMFVTKENVADFTAVRDLAASLGCRFRYDSFMFPTFEGGMEPYAHSLTIRESLGLDCLMDANAPEYWFDLLKRRADDELGSAMSWIRLKRVVGEGRLFRCKAARSSLFITSSNKARMCYMIPEIEADLENMTIEEAWETFARYADAPVNPNSECEFCSDREVCNVCPARLRLENGRYDSVKRVESLCAIMREKHKMRDEWALHSASQRLTRTNDHESSGNCSIVMKSSDKSDS